MLQVPEALYFIEKEVTHSIHKNNRERWLNAIIINLFVFVFPQWILIVFPSLSIPFLLWNSQQIVSELPQVNWKYIIKQPESRLPINFILGSLALIIRHCANYIFSMIKFASNHFILSVVSPFSKNTNYISRQSLSPFVIQLITSNVWKSKCLSWLRVILTEITEYIFSHTISRQPSTLLGVGDSLPLSPSSMKNQ